MARFTLEHGAFMAMRWRFGTTQPVLAKEYGASTPAVNVAINNFLRETMPDKFPLVQSCYSPDYYVPYCFGDRRKLVEEAAIRWAAKGRLFIDPSPILSQQRIYRVVKHSRPIDMGGPRDVWLEFGVPADPRLDNMYPVSAHG
jgi:hypothetical protein